MRPSVTMIAPQRAQCGISDYTDHLLPELRRLADVRYVADAGEFSPEMNEVDLAHIQHEYFLFGGVAPWKARFQRLARQLRGPAVMTVHEIVEATGPPARRAAIHLSNRLHLAHPVIKRYIVHTRSDRERLVTAGIDPARVRVIRHGVPLVPDLPDREEARAELGLDGRFVLLLFGFLSRRKGHRLALSALQSLPADVSLVFAGGRHPEDKTDYGRDLEREVADLGSSGRARITGYLDDAAVRRLMSAADVVLAPFTESSGSGSLALAFACGKPIIASDIAPHREILEDTPGALKLFPSGDSAALANAIETLSADQKALTDLAAGASRYAAKHSYGRMAEETVEVYRDVLAEAGR